ncbi:MAG: methionine--tRNA ligase subunit beta [Candidatus Spechtbacterales bacterium]
MINFEDFAKIELKIATIKSAENVDGSDKLLRLVVDVGEEEERQVLAGIAKKYNFQDIVGRQIVVVANLEPRKLMGLESQGMLLAASSEDGPVLLIPEKDVEPGSSVS